MEKKSKRISNYFHRGDDLTRITALSDGLFATVLTILVLDLKPDVLATGSTPDIVGYLRLIWSGIFNFLLTFVVAGLFWIGHHWIFEHIVVYNRRLLWLNLMFLLSVVLLPFTTALLGVTNVPINIRWVIYASAIILIGLTNIIMWEYAYDNHLTDPLLDPKLVLYVRVRHAAAPVIFLLSIVFEPLLHGLVFYFPVLILPVLILASRVMLKAERAKQSESNSPSGKRLMKSILWQVLSYLPLVIFLAVTVWITLINRK